ncbi:hypothetical protein T484DRAFT_2272085 [Baffinella frigidus]|nr:hypothetical protein T484DRAFT_2272085 [Cryptophyta sp. CCMP2293]
MGSTEPPKIPTWASTPPDDSFELESLLPEGPQTIKLGTRSHLILGRSSTDATITLKCPTASRVHALLVYNGEDGVVYVIDLKSAHGTFVDGAKIKEYHPTPLKLSQDLRFGNEDGGAKFRVKGVPSRKRKSEGSSRDGADDGKAKKQEKQEKGKTVRCSHVLLKHKDSRKTQSDRDPEGKVIKARSKEQAIAALEGYRADVQRGEVSFGELAKRISECSSWKRSGDLGHFEFHKMQAAFSEVAFKLGIGDVSGTVESESGVHLIKRLE